MKTDPAVARQSLLAAAVGVALAAGSLCAALLARVWVAAFPFAMLSVQVGLAIAIAAAAGLLAVCALQVAVWARRAAGLRRASWWAHVASYLLVVLLLGGLVVGAAAMPLDSTGFWLAFGAMVLGLAAQAIGATQYLRTDGPPGSLRAHLAGAIARSNARADAVADAADDADGQRGVNR